MIASLCLSFAPWAVPSPSPATSAPAPVSQDVSLDARLAAAGKDVAKLLELAAACTSEGKEADARKVFKRVLELDAKNEAAHLGLRHQLYDGKWFESLTELAKYKREEAARMKLKGLVRFQDTWVPEADLPFLNMGWAKDAQGAWVQPAEAARAKEAAEREAAGFKFRADDNSWVAPADLDKWQALLWKCGDEWVDMAKANAYHATLEHTWELAGEHFLVSTTCDWEGGNLARWHAEKAYPELVRLFGVEPKSKPHFVVLNSLAQYNEVAGNTPALPEADGFSSLHGAYFADLYYDTSTKPPQYAGCGVSYWDRKDAKAASWGPLWARFAAAQSFVEALDPSWIAISEDIAAAGASRAVGQPEFAPRFWAEKSIPRWLRYGAASYVERFMKDPDAGAGADPWKLRAGVFTELKKGGGLRRLDEVFAFKLDLKDIPGSARLYQEAGLIIAFLLDGAEGNKELASKHAAFQAALKAGKKADVAKAAEALEKALLKCDRDIRKFGGL